MNDSHFFYGPEDSTHYRAPQNLFAHCALCGLCIIPGEIIVDWRGDESVGTGEYAHGDCAEDAANSDSQ